MRPTESPIEAFPLCWPEGHPRTPPSARKRGMFQLTPDAAQQDLRWAVQALGGSRLIVSTNVPVRRDGGIYSNAREPADPGVAIYFDWNGAARSMACDTYDRVFKNVRGLTLCIEALRALDRHGSSAILERAFRGFAALPASASGEAWYTVLGVSHTATADEIRAAYHRAALAAHPDKPGGSDAAFARVKDALALGLAAVGGG